MSGNHDVNVNLLAFYISSFNSSWRIPRLNSIRSRITAHADTISAAGVNGGRTAKNKAMTATFIEEIRPPPPTKSFISH